MQILSCERQGGARSRQLIRRHHKPHRRRAAVAVK